MAKAKPSNEHRLYEAFQQVVDVLLPLEKSLRERAHATVGTFFGYAASNAERAPVPAPAPTRPPAAKPAAKPPRPAAAPEPKKEVADVPGLKDFISQKQPDTDVERVACLAYYLARHRHTKLLKTNDITALNAASGHQKFANASSTMNNATASGFLAIVSKGKKKLSPAGLRYVETLPDRAAAKAAMRKERRKQSARK